MRGPPGIKCTAVEELNKFKIEVDLMGNVWIFNNFQGVWVNYSDVYNAIRSRLEIVIGYGLEEFRTKEARTGIESARQHIIRWKHLSGKERQKIGALLEEYGFFYRKTKKGGHPLKTQAKAKISSAAELYNSRGRINPSVMAARISAALRYISERAEICPEIVRWERLQHDVLMKEADIEEDAIIFEAGRLTTLFGQELVEFEKLHRRIVKSVSPKSRNTKVDRAILEQLILGLIKELNITEKRLRFNIRIRPWLSLALRGIELVKKTHTALTGEQLDLKPIRKELRAFVTAVKRTRNQVPRLKVPSMRRKGRK